MRTRIFRFSEKLKKARITSQISLLTKQTHFNRLSVFCSFTPSPHKYKSILWGPLTLKSQNFDEIVFFSAGSEKSSVLGVHDFSGSAEKAEYRKIMTFYFMRDFVAESLMAQHNTCIAVCNSSMGGYDGAIRMLESLKSIPRG